jgi:hypothetical protein
MCKTILATSVSMINKNSNHKQAYAGQLNNVTRLRALLALHDRGLLGQQ